MFCYIVELSLFYGLNYLKSFNYVWNLLRIYFVKINLLLDRFNLISMFVLTRSHVNLKFELLKEGKLLVELTLPIGYVLIECIEIEGFLMGVSVIDHFLLPYIAFRFNRLPCEEDRIHNLGILKFSIFLFVCKSP